MIVPSVFTLGHFFNACCDAYSDRTAFRFEGRSFSYREVSALAHRLAGGLAAAGVKKGAHVALLMGNRPEWVISAFAISLVGGVLVPMSTFATASERDHMLAHSDATMILYQPKIANRDLVAELRDCALPSYCLGSSWDALIASGGECPEVPVSPDDDALILYTSGTTAEPKGIVHRHHTPVHQCLHFANYLGLTTEDRMWTVQPFFWAAGIAVSLGGTLASGGTMLLQEIFDAERSLDLIEAERATVIRSWPHQDKAMAEHPSAKGRDLSSVKKLNFSSPLAPMVGLSRDEWGTQGGYGLSETFTVVSDLPASAPAELRRTTSGKPLPGMDVRIVDPQTGVSVESGKVGEIIVKGVTLMRGYYKVPCEQCFDRDGFFHTQDSGFLDDNGYLHWTGRMSNLIKTGGANVSPLEIEKLMIGFPGVRIAAAVGVPDAALGEMVVLCVVLNAGAQVDAEKVRAFLRERLASYKVPRHVLAFGLDEVEFTGTDKLRIDHLRQKASRSLSGGLSD